MMLWGKGTIVLPGLRFHLVRLSSSTCDFQGHYVERRKNGGSHAGLEVAFVAFAHIPLAETQFHAPSAVAR